MRTLLTDISQIVTVNTNGNNFKKGNEMNSLSILEEHSILFDSGKILDLIPNSKIHLTLSEQTISAGGRTVLPGFVECHTHSLFVGSRANEFKLKLQGATYEEISKGGGGILSTVKAVRESDISNLSINLENRIKSFIKQGVTSLEIKSGYGLNFESEMKMLSVIQQMKNRISINLVPTFLGAHTYPTEHKNAHDNYIHEIVNEMLPYVRKNQLADFCDVFCESTAFSAAETLQIFTAAKKHDLKLKIHTEQFNNIGGFEVAIENGCTSIDHLEVLTEGQIKSFESCDSVATLLPGVSFFLNYQFAPARKIIDAGGIVALATDFNPGSSHISKISFIMALAALKMKMSVEEIISAYTINAAKAIALEQRCGSIEIGKDADFAILNCEDYADLIYNFSEEINYMTFSKGKIIYQSELENHK